MLRSTNLVLPTLSVLMATGIALTGLVTPAASRAGDGLEASAVAAPRLVTLRSRAQAAVLAREYLIGSWETHNIEFGRDVRIVWTVRGDSSLDYDFVVDGVASRGSSGTWDFRDGMLIENWSRPDGTTGAGRASIERIDDNSFRLTIIDNGNADYRGLVRIYRRRSGPQTVELIPR